MKPSELFEGENSSLKKTYDEATKTLEETLFKIFKLFLAEKCYDEKLYGDGKYDKKIFNWAFQAGKDSMKEEILSKLPERKSENKKKKDQDEWINIPRIQRAVGFNSCLNQVKNIIKNV
jgi:hypothetical protein